MAKESLTILRGAAPALKPVFVPTSALPSMTEQAEEAKPGAKHVLLGYVVHDAGALSTP